MTDWASEKAHSILPCICLPDYKDRNLTQPDCPRCNYGEDVAQALREKAPPSVGSFSWALEQMRAGKQVINPELTEPILLRSNGAILAVSDDPSGDDFAFGPEDFGRADWRIAEDIE